jgi:plasmid replication initiation protein
LTNALRVRHPCIVTAFRPTDFLPAFVEPAAIKSARPLRATDVQVTGQPLDPNHIGRIIKPRELVELIELTPLNRAETILLNQLLAHAWNNILTVDVHKVLKASLRGSHESNDRLDEALDNLMSAWAKIKVIDPDTKEKAYIRVSLLGTNKIEDRKDGYFHYTFPPDLLAVFVRSRAWASIKTHIMYALRSKYSIRLYELVERRINMVKQSEEFTVDELRGLLGVPEGKLERFADFNKHCLKPALEEANQLTDFFIDVMPVKKGRAIEKLYMYWSTKDADGLKRAHEERERCRVGRKARRDGTTEMIQLDVA